MSETLETIAYCHSCGAAMNVSSVAPFTNVACPKCGKHTRVKREFGPYTLIRRHAIGGMSMVFSAHDNTLNREVALKILSEEFSADERRIKAFEEEARITASFSHPHVVRVLTTGYAFGRFYIAMEWVPGGHFEHHIHERGKIPELEMLPLAIEVAHGLKAAHAAGLIHRDVKPGNILLDAEGHTKLVDFGLALVTQGGKAQATELWATPYYVPPETVEGAEEDFRSDIYAFGATLYHALAGKPSCGEESMATDVLREAKKKVTPLSAEAPWISAETCRVIERAMAYAPADRFSSYDELIASLTISLNHLKSGYIEPIPISPAKRRAEKKRKERTSIAIGIVAFAASATTAGWWIHHLKSTPKPATSPVVQPRPALPVLTPASAPPLTPDPSTEIAKTYREARAAVVSKNFQQAAQDFHNLHQNPAVQEPSRTWAGMEVVLVCFLDGRNADACNQAAETLQHIQSLPSGISPGGAEWIATLEKIGNYPAIPTPRVDPKTGRAPHLIAAMLAGLKNWESGQFPPAIECFEAAASIQLPPDDEWATIYQHSIADYLADYQVLSHPIFKNPPSDQAACKAAIEALVAMHSSLKTRGRASFNVRAWQLDIARHAKLLRSTPSSPPISN